MSKELQTTVQVTTKNAKSQKQVKKNNVPLEDQFNSFIEKNELKVGDKVRWKKGLRNKVFPLLTEKAIVLEVLKKPIISDKEDSGSPYFKEPLDLILATKDHDGDMLTLYFDSRRFELDTQD